MSSNKNISSCIIRNGFGIVSLLGFFILFLLLNGCISSKSGKNDYTSAKTANTSRKDKKKRDEIISTAIKYLGTPYKSAGKDERGFDCSGFTYFVMKSSGINLGASSRAQAQQGVGVEIYDLKKGDLIFFGSNGSINHVGIVTHNLGNKLTMIHSSSSRGIIEEDIYRSDYWSARIVCGRSVVE